MSDERVDIVLREAGPGGKLEVFRRFWNWVKRNFPLITKSGADFTRAKVSQEDAKAAYIRACAEVESAKAEQIRAQTRLLLGDLPMKNAVFAAESRRRDEEVDEQSADILQIIAKLQSLHVEAERLGVKLTIEDLSENPKRLLPGAREQASED